jgi:hypothetical protein
MLISTNGEKKDFFSRGLFLAYAMPNDSYRHTRISDPYEAVYEAAKNLLQRIFPSLILGPGGPQVLANGKLLRPNAEEYKSQSKAEVGVSVIDQSYYSDPESVGPFGGIVFQLTFKGPIDDFIVDIHKRISQSVVEAAQTPEFRGDADTLQVIDSFSRNWPSEATFHQQTDSAESRPRMQA